VFPGWTWPTPGLRQSAGGDLAVDDLDGIDRYPGFAGIVHHDMEMGRRMILGIDAHHAMGKALDNRHGAFMIMQWLHVSTTAWLL